MTTHLNPGGRARQYRVYKLDGRTHRITAVKDMSAPDDGAAMEAASHDDDCPVCEVWQSARKVGLVE